MTITPSSDELKRQVMIRHLDMYHSVCPTGEVKRMTLEQLTRIDNVFHESYQRPY